MRRKTVYISMFLDADMNMWYVVGIASNSRLKIFRSYKFGAYRSIFSFSLQQDTLKCPYIGIIGIKLKSTIYWFYLFNLKIYL